MNTLKHYQGRVPACGVFCGGCPTYVRDRNPCPGADINSARCESCKTFHLCCLDHGVTHCHNCPDYPCKKFKSFSKRWEKYGQNFVENQALLKAEGAAAFLQFFNCQAISHHKEPDQGKS